MRYLATAAPAFLLILLLAGCSIFGDGKKKAKDNAKSAKPQPAQQGGGMMLIGIVEMVNPEQNYVLIHCEQLNSLPPGTELIGLDASGAQARLVLTPERKGHYLTADIKAGNPKVTDLVMQKKSADATLPPPATAAPAATTLPALPPTNPLAPPPPAPPGGGLPLEPSLPLPQLSPTAP